MKKNYFARKLRILKNSVIKLESLSHLTDNNANQIFQLKNKIKNLFNELKFVVSGRKLKKIALTFGLILASISDNQIKAQHFLPSQTNPFSTLSKDYFIDLDNDGDLDLLRSGKGRYYNYYGGGYGYYGYTIYSGGNSSLSYYKNEVVGGVSNFVYQNEVASIGGHSDLYTTAVDIDSDGDLDLMINQKADFYNPVNLNNVIYILNIGSADTPSFDVFNYVTIGSSASLIASPILKDIDGDSDLDLFVNSTSGIRFWQNTGTNLVPNFASGVNNPFGLTSDSNKKTLIDLDNDADFDIVSNSNNSLIFHENTGSNSSPTFANSVMNPFGFTQTVNIFGNGIFVDFDQDNDMDFLVSTFEPDLIYFENTGTPNLPSFSVPISNPFCINPAGSLHNLNIGDIENDGDVDFFGVNTTSQTLEFFAQDMSGTTFYLDTDNDGYGDINNSSISVTCTLAGYVTNNTDCDDNNPGIWYTSQLYVDSDGDGFGTGLSQTVCRGLNIPNNYSINNSDCDDSDPDVFYSQWAYVDSDLDGYGAGNGEEICIGNTLPDGFVTNPSDCNDSDPDIGMQTMWFVDSDGDGHGFETLTYNYYYGGGFYTSDAIYACNPPIGFVASNDDCEPNNNLIHPNAVELDNGIDDNCDGSIDNLNVYESSIENQVKIWPNPGENLLFIEKTSNLEIEEIKCISLNGKIINISTNELVFNSDKIEINTENWSKSVYFIEIKTSNGVQNFKWVKK
ncbi:MAG: T9SS type A sorting domain-containing protein [Flavobacteriia bacterium]|jgi:hypothetical protein